MDKIDKIFNLAIDNNLKNRRHAAFVFRHFYRFPDKEKAWNVFQRLAEDEDSIVRQNAAIAFTSFSDFPDKEKAWNALQRLTEDEKSTVRQNAAFAFHSAYTKVIQKEKLLDLLFSLTGDRSNQVKAAAYYSLARIYVYESSKIDSKQLFVEKYNKAIYFFEKSYNITNWDKPKFCFTIHSLFHKILIGDVKNVDDIKKSINQWKSKPKSDERHNLLEILNVLSDILEESLIAKENGEDAWMYKKKIIPFCDQAEEYIEALKHEGMKEIATKAKGKIEDDYFDTINILLNKVNNSLSDPKLLNEEQFIRIAEDFCELIHEPIICERINQNILEIKEEKDKRSRDKLIQLQITNIKYFLELESNQKERELEYKDEIISAKDKESKKGWDLLKYSHSEKNVEYNKKQKLNVTKFFEFLAISVTIAGGSVWAIIYPKLIEMKYPTAWRESLIIFIILFILISIILFKKR